MLSLEEWFASGERVTVEVPRPAEGAAPFRIFCRVVGSGPWLTFLHGFPTCSWDWAAMADTLAARYRLLMFDFLGYGDSDKPRGHDYSIFEQADVVQALWGHFGVERTGLVAHDFGDTVATELLARQNESRLATRIEAALLLNGGVYVDLYHPLPIQTALQRPVVGAALSRLITERSFNRSFARIFSERHPIAPGELRQHWEAVHRRDGTRNYHRLIRYIGERRRHKARWEAALEHPGVPARYVWGMLDPVSGGQMMHRLRERIPDASIRELHNIGHYPQIEVPDVVASEILRFFAAATKDAPGSDVPLVAEVELPQ